MDLQKQLTELLGERGGRQIRLTQTEYSKEQHELCQTIAQVLWGDKGLIESLGQTWFLVMDPRFMVCETIFHTQKKITGSANGEAETGLIEIDDMGNVSASRLMSLEEYAEIIGEARHYIKVIRSDAWKKIAGEGFDDPRAVKDWGFFKLDQLIRLESPNYYTDKGYPNQLAKIWVKLFYADVLGMILDYAELSNIDQWVHIDTGDVAMVTDRADPDHPIAHAEIEYLDRALMYRASLRANAVKILTKLGGPALESAIENLTLTEYEKDSILQEVLSFPYDELYKALPLVLVIMKDAKQVSFEQREEEQLKAFRHQAQVLTDKLRTGERTPLDLLDGDHAALDQESEKFAKIKGDEDLTTLFFIQVQAEEMVKAYPRFQEVIDKVTPFVDGAQEPPRGEALDVFLEEIQALVDEVVTQIGAENE
jgi:hypothetical protein